MCQVGWTFVPRLIRFPPLLTFPHFDVPQQTLVYSFPSEAFSDVAGWLEERVAAGNIRRWVLSEPSLEAVFLEVARSGNADRTAVEELVTSRAALQDARDGVCRVSRACVRAFVWVCVGACVCMVGYLASVLSLTPPPSPAPFVCLQPLAPTLTPPNSAARRR